MLGEIQTPPNTSENRFLPRNDISFPPYEESEKDLLQRHDKTPLYHLLLPENTLVTKANLVQVAKNELNIVLDHASEDENEKLRSLPEREARILVQEILNRTRE